MKQKYIILRAASSDLLAQGVSEKIDEGYVLAGPLLALSNDVLCQPMILLENATEMMAVKLFEDMEGRQ